MNQPPIELNDPNDPPCGMERAIRDLYWRLREEMASQASRSAGARTTLAWGRRYLPAHFAKAPSAMHEWLGAQLDRFKTSRGLKINLIGPRGAAKSTIATLALVLRAAVEGWEAYIWIVSDTRPQAQMHLENIKSELIENKRLANHYPDATGRGPRWRATFVELRNGVVIESLSTGQGVRGRRRQAERPTLIICDDLQNDGHISSAIERAATRRWFHGTLLHAGSGRTNIVNLATALHREALAMELHGAPGWRSKRFAAIRRWPTNLDLWNQWEKVYCDASLDDATAAAREFYKRHQSEMNDGAEVLWPAVEDLYALMQRRIESGRAAFEREKQGSPFDPERCEWPDDYFEDHIWFDTWPEGLVIKTMALDPSKGADARRGDYSAYVMIGIDHCGVVYVEGDLARRPTSKMVVDGANLCKRFCPSAIGVEANQFQELLCDELATEFARAGVHLVPAAIHNRVNKQLRIRRLGPYLSQRRMRFLRGSPSTRLVVDQLRDFPDAAHDDGPDALEMAIRLAEDVGCGRAPDDGLGRRLCVG